MKFKIGQKVYIKTWFDMPPALIDGWGNITMWNTEGEVGIIDKDKGLIDGEVAYDIKLSTSKYRQLVFEQELEPVIEVGEQLTFDFIKEK